MSKWLFLFLLLPFSAQAEGRKTLDFDLPCGSKKVTVQYQSSDDLHVRLHRPEKCSGGSSTSFGVELGLRTGFYSGGDDTTPAITPNLGLTLGFNKAWFLRANAGAGLALHGPISDFSVGLGSWITDQFRITASGGQIVHRTTGWSWSQGSVVGKLSADYFISPQMFIGLEVFGGPSWDRNDKASGSFGSALGLGWRF